MSFKDVLGQDRQIEIIKKAIENNRVPHAYLFLGEEGVGKKRTALTLAKALNCCAEPADSCDECGPCRKIINGNHPDVTVVEPEGNSIKINQIRGLQRSLQYKPYEGKKKVCIIPNAEKMNPASANSILKTLEEPPPETVLILITTSSHLLLSTINSRCQKLKFQPLTNDLISKIIKEKVGKDEETSLKIASLAGGNLNRAYELSEGTTLEYRNRLIEKINALSPNNINETFEFAEEMSKEKEELVGALQFLKAWFRDILIFKEGCPLDRLINADFLEEIKRLSGRFTTTDLLRKLRIINDAELALLRNSNKRLTLEVMLGKLCQ
ncbi:MAG: DNA polymerase III subunit delta' [Desulfobacterales bacterium]|jgi:DNA polymerase-3 subunit delta'|nr:DNA polymerase III subunit delta' [Desulfobacterales bacterium]